MIFSVHSVAFGNDVSFNSLFGDQEVGGQFSRVETENALSNAVRIKEDVSSPREYTDVKLANFCERIYVKSQEAVSGNSLTQKIYEDIGLEIVSLSSETTREHIFTAMRISVNQQDFTRRCNQHLLNDEMVQGINGNEFIPHSDVSHEAGHQEVIQPQTTINSECCTGGICVSSTYMETCNEFETTPEEMTGLENIGKIAQMMKIYVNSEKGVELTLQKGSENFCNKCYEKTATSLGGDEEKFQENRNKYLAEIKEKVAQQQVRNSFKKLQIYNEALVGSQVMNELTGEKKQPAMCSFSDDMLNKITSKGKCQKLKEKYKNRELKFNELMSDRRQIALNATYGKGTTRTFDSYVDFMEGRFVKEECTNPAKHSLYKAGIYHSTETAREFIDLISLVQYEGGLEEVCMKGETFNPITYLKDTLSSKAVEAMAGESNLFLYADFKNKLKSKYNSTDREEFNHYIESYVDQAINYDSRVALLLSNDRSFCQMISDGRLGSFHEDLYGARFEDEASFSDKFSKIGASVKSSCDGLYKGIEDSLCVDSELLEPKEADVIKFAPEIKFEIGSVENANLEVIALNSAICKLASNDPVQGGMQFENSVSPLDSLLESRQNLMNGATDVQRSYLDYNRFGSGDLNIVDGECKGASERNHSFAFLTMLGVDGNPSESQLKGKSKITQNAFDKSGNFSNESTKQDEAKVNDIARNDRGESGYVPASSSNLGSVTNPAQRELGRNNAKSADEMGILRGRGNSGVGFSSGAPSGVGSGTSTASTSSNSVSSNFMDRLDKIVSGGTTTSTGASTTQIRERKFPLAEPISSAEVREIKHESPAITQKIEEIKRDLSEENISGEKLDEYLEGRDGNLPATVANSDLRAEIEKLKAQIQAQALNSRTSGNESELRDKLSEAEARISELDTAMQTVQSRNAASTSNNSESLQNLVGSQVGSSGEGRISASISEREQSSSISQGVGNIRAGSSLKTKRLPNEFFEADTYGETLKLEMSKDSELILSVEGSWYEFVEPVNRNSLQISNGRVVGIKIEGKTIEVSKFSNEQRQIINDFAGDDFIKLSEEKSLLEKIVVPVLRRNIASVEDTSVITPTGVTYQQLLDFNNPGE